MLVVFFAVLAATGYLYVKVPKGFIPEADTDTIYVNSEAAQGTSFYQMFEVPEDGRSLIRIRTSRASCSASAAELGLERIAIRAAMYRAI